MPVYESTEEYLNSTQIGRQIIRIRENVSDALTAIGAKGVTVPSGSNSDDLADLIAQISGGGATYETHYDGSITAASDKTISIPSLSSLYFAAGETWRVTWDGTEYTCYPNVHEGWLWYIGNHGLTDGTDDGVSEPFCLYNYGGGALNGMARTSGTHTLKLEKQTSSGGGGSATLITKNITANGTYSAEDDDADGYSEVTVNVPSSVASSWTKVAETSYQVSTSSTSASTVATWATGHSEIWTSSKWVYVRIRDTAGKQNGYYYGGDQFFFNIVPINGTTSTYIGTAMSLCIRYSASGFNTTGASTATSYGVYADRLYSNGDLRIRVRYSSANTTTINGTYKVEVYLLDPPTGAPIFT